MNPGLRYLLAKGPTVLRRRFARRLRGAKGIVTLVGMGLLILLIAGPQIARIALQDDTGQRELIVASARLFGPPMLLALILLTSASGGFQFRPAEIQFLFPAPVGRRELLVYNALAKLRLQLVSGLWISIFTLSHAPHWYGALVATCLIMAFWQLAAQTIGLLLATIEQRLGARIRKAVMLAAAGFLLGGVLVAGFGSPAGAGIRATLESIASWPPFYWLSLPLRPLVEIYVAARFTDFLLWSGISLALLALLFPLMTMFDVAYTESAIARAQKLQRAIERMRAGGSPFAAGRPGRGALHVPRLPYWRGAGPIAWRQLQEMTRNYRSLIMMGAILFLFIGAFKIMPRFMDIEGPARAGMPAPALFAIVAFMLPMMTMHSAFDFRRDLNRMAVLKALPVSGFALVLGQIVPTTLLLCFWELVAMIALGVTGSAADWRLFAAILPGLVPLNATLVAIDNVLFLLMPYRAVARDPGQMPFMPRLMLVTFLKMFLLFVVGALVAVAVAFVWMLSRSMLLTGLAAAALLTLICSATIWGTAAAFRAFDVSRDIPD